MKKDTKISILAGLMVLFLPVTLVAIVLVLFYYVCKEIVKAVLE